MNKLGIFVKQPTAGRVKTRLARDIGDENAAALYDAFIAVVTQRFAATGDQRSLCYAPAEATPYFEQLAGADYQLWQQPEGDLGVRLHGFFAEHLVAAEDRVIVIGSDSPTLPEEYIERGFELLNEADCVVGPAADGGYYLIGMQGRLLPVFAGIAWSGATVLDQTVSRIVDAGATLAMLPVWYDVDTAEDLRLLRGHVRALRHAQSPLNLDAVAQILDKLTDDPY
ncbi:TIGR04282 family arsenosugar biosynthesis glycosyltransferase [Symmachiella dynata]|uniref:TIGR04282 family arsenosugar biosynthesis glycosyltransferase n=1 Tax=Symmachiella dynata TaxID=2527995 RepID=UPI0030EF1D69